METHHTSDDPYYDQPTYEFVWESCELCKGKKHFPIHVIVAYAEYREFRSVIYGEKSFLHRLLLVVGLSLVFIAFAAPLLLYLSATWNIPAKSELQRQFLRVAPVFVCGVLWFLVSQIVLYTWKGHKPVIARRSFEDEHPEKYALLKEWDLLSFTGPKPAFFEPHSGPDWDYDYGIEWRIRKWANRI